MARLPASTEPSKAYVGMLSITAVAMLVGITALVLEAGEYDWVQKPPTVSAPKLPDPPKEEKSASVVVPKPFEAVKVTEPAPSQPAALPVPPALPPAPASVVKPDVVVEAPKPVEPKPLPPTGAIPSPLIIPGR